MINIKDRKAYIIGGGVAGVAAAAFLIKDAGMKGGNIIIIDRESVSGGGFDGQGSAEHGYLSRGYRMFEEIIYLSTYDLFSKIPSPDNPNKTLKDDFFAFNAGLKIIAKARLIKDGKILDSSRMELNWRDRINLVKLLYYPEKYFGTKKISDFFTAHFFKSNFWFMWATTYAFQPWHAVLEMKRYLCRFVHDAPRFNMSCVLSAPYCEHDFIILPLVKMLNKSGARFLNNAEVTDLDFALINGKKTVTDIIFRDAGRENIKVAHDDLVFVTNGSMMTDATVGSMDKPPTPATGNSTAWNLWKNISKKSDGFGNPEVFCSSTQKTGWESFTITFKDSAFFELVEKLSGNKAGTGGLITFKDSNWLMSITLPPQPYFKNQPAGTFVCWGYGLSPDKTGNFVNKKMSECGGKEIMEELFRHFGFSKDAPSIIKNALCIPCFMPYITAQFSPRNKSDRPAVVPPGTRNFAFIGQFVEIPNEIVFTVECSIRSAKTAVCRLLNLSEKIPPLYQKKYNIKSFFDGFRTILR